MGIWMEWGEKIRERSKSCQEDRKADTDAETNIDRKADTDA